MAVKDRGSALEGFAALYDGSGNADATVFERVQTKCTLDYELVRLCQEKGDKPHKGTPLGRFLELWPFDMLKRALIDHANTFVSQIGMQGFVPLTSVYEFRVWGPFTEKVGAMRPWVPEEGNHTIPRHLQRTAQKVWGYEGDEFNFDKGCAFIIAGDFTRKASLGHVNEETGVIVV